MAHGTPDYGVTAGAVTTYQLKDLGELAVRLGSPITHDRRGDVIWWDDAECGAVKWASTLVGVNASFGASTDRARNGRRSYKLRPGDAVNDLATMTHVSPFSNISRLGMEFSFSLTGELRRLEWIFSLRDGTDSHLFQVRWDDGASVLQYLNAASAYVTFASVVNLHFDATLFHTGKLVIDPTTDRYVRFVLNNTEYDLSGFSEPVSASPIDPIVQMSITEETLAVTPTGTYIDDIILTQNEPAQP
jgi:hypothetical protein